MIILSFLTIGVVSHLLNKKTVKLIEEANTKTNTKGPYATTTDRS